MIKVIVYVAAISMANISYYLMAEAPEDGKLTPKVSGPDSHYGMWFQVKAGGRREGEEHRLNLGLSGLIIAFIPQDKLFNFYSSLT